MQKTQHLTDEEIDRLGYEALKEKLGILGALRFITLQTEPSGESYAEIRDKIFEGMTLEEVYEEAVRLESKRKKRPND